MRVFLSRLRALVRGRASSLSELEEEIASHVEMLTAEYERRGLDPDEARRRAQSRLGSRESIREAHYESLGIPFFDALARDLRHGFRVLRRDRAFTLGVALTLGLGIGVATSVFTLVDALLLRSLPYRNAGELILMARLPMFDFVESRPTFQDWKRASTLLADAALYAQTEVNIEGGGEALHVSLAQVTANFPGILGSEPILGRNFLPDEDIPHGPRVAMISARLWRTQFHGDPLTIGRRLAINGVPFTIVGVLPPRFDYPARTDVWTPTVHSEESLSQFGATMNLLVARMKPGVTASQVAAQQRSAFGKRYKGLDQDLVSTVSGMRAEQPPIARGFRDQLSARADQAVLLLFGAVTLILLIACANIANLALARAVSREREFAIRRALGVSSAGLLRQIATEQTLAGALGGLVGIAVAYASLPMLRFLLPGDWPSYAAIRIGPRVLVFATGISFLAGLATALLPSVKLIRRAPGRNGSLGQGDRLSEDRGQRKWRHALVATEIAIAMALLAGTGALVESLIRLAGVPPGFQPQGLLALSVTRPDARTQDAGGAQAFYRQAFERLRRLPGVQTAAAVDFLPTRPKSIAIIPVKRDPADQGDGASARAVTPGYFRAMRIPLLAGRDFTDRDDKNAARVTIVSDILASKLWPGESGVGRFVSIPGGKPARVVGIAGSVRFFGPRANPMPEVYFPYTQATPDSFTFLLRTSGPPAALSGAARQAIQEVNASQPVDEIATMEDYWTRSMSNERSLTALASIFTTLGIVLSVVGIYALITYTMRCREREFGIRLALGAMPGSLIIGSVWREMAWVAPGIVAGSAIAFAARRVLESELYEARAWEPGLVAALALGLAAVSGLAALTGARRAAVVDPARLLRWE